MNNTYREEYLSYIEFERRLSKNTVASYANDLDKYYLFLKKRNISSVSKITKKDILDYLEYLSK